LVLVALEMPQPGREPKVAIVSFPPSHLKVVAVVRTLRATAAMEDLVEAQGLLLLVAQAAQQQPVKATTAATILIAAQQL
jgi:hypothetical protein